MKPHLFLARAGFAVIWERKPGDIRVLWNDGTPVAGPVGNHASTALWIWSSASVAEFLLEEWKDSEDFIPGSDFRVCQVTGAFTAWQASEQEGQEGGDRSEN